jgi:hypothetical protein
MVKESMEMLESMVSDQEFPPLNQIEAMIKRGKNLQVGGNTMLDPDVERLDLASSPSNPDFTFYSAELLTHINHLANEHFSGIWSDVATNEDEYTNALTSYMRDVITHIRKVCSSHVLTDRVVSRFRWLISRHSRVFVGLPIVTQSVFESFSIAFNTVPVAIMEICRWFEPLLGYKVHQRGENRWFDLTTLVHNAIHRDRRILNKDRAITLVCCFIC